MSKKRGIVTIDVYDEDGVYHEGIGGPMTFEDVKHQMLEILKNDGIPVIRTRGKHEAKDERLSYELKHEKLPDLKAICEKVLKDLKPEDEMKVLKLPKIEHIPMVLEYKFDGIEFRAAGHPLDVHAANNALLKRVFEE